MANEAHLNRPIIDCHVHAYVDADSDQFPDGGRDKILAKPALHLQGSMSV